MKKIRSVLSLIMIVAMLLTFASCKKSEDVGTSGTLNSGVVWSYNEDKAKLTVKGNGEIPDGTTIFSDNFADEVETLVIKEGVTAIGSKVFSGFENLEKVTLPSSLKSIGDEAFYKCSDLEKIRIPENVTEMGSRAVGFSSKNEVTDTKVLTSNDYVVSWCKENNISYIQQIVCTATVNNALTYNGSVQHPSISVIDEDGLAVSEDEYTVKYSDENSTDAGTYTVKITMNDDDYYLAQTEYEYAIAEPETSSDYSSEATTATTTDETETSQEETSVSDTTAESTTETTTEEATISIDNNSNETTTESTTESTAATTTETTAKSSDSTPYVGAVKNGTLTYENGKYYITDSSTGVKFLIVNKTYTVPEDYNPGSLTSECSAAFNKLVAGAKADGIDISLISGFRSYSYQSQLYNNYVARDGKAEADTYSARPGHSEHQTGLAIDCNSLSSSFADTAEGKWLAAHCAEYGFILRYREGTESKTGYMYEPWHIRYLGSVKLAKKLTDSGLCIEEYYGISSKY